jgi:phage gpG-like protein
MKIELKIKKLPQILQQGVVEKNLRRAVMIAAETYVRDIHDWIDSGRAFKPRTGNLQRSITWYMTNNSARIIAQADYAKWVEFGTKPHTILPKRRKALKIPTPEGYIFRKRVSHPGSKPYPYFFVNLQDRVKGVALEFMKALEGVI